jgi:DNA-binding LytR/AlgR family response regulator
LEKALKKILLIEDEYTVRVSIRELLEAGGYKVFSASDGEEGIQLACEISPDLIICDVMMPKLNGHEVFEKLRGNTSFEMVPFIFLTAKAELSDIREGMDLGADDYITKPFRAQSLLKAVETRLNKFEGIRQQKAAAETNENKKQPLNENDRIFVTVNNKPQILRIGDILCIKAEGEYSTVILVSGAKLLLRRLIKQWEEQLPSSLFLRIHRSTIINLNQIEKIEKWFNRSFVVSLKNSGEKLTISQRYAKKIKNNFGL